MENSGQYLHLWAIVPPADIAQEIDDLRKEFSVNFQCFKALKPPVHLTLYTLFKSTIPDVESRIEPLSRWISRQPAFSLELKNFNFFEYNRVVFIDVVANPDIKALNAGLSHETKKLLALSESGKPQYHPHFTIGYRDISPEIFPQVKQAYNRRLFHAVFDVEHVCLFRHNRVKWELQYELPLSGEVIEQGTLFA